MNFLTELKRRNVYRAAVFYAASAWLLVQVATQVFPFFHIAEWVVRWIVVAAAIGFPFVLLFSWFYEWTPQGIQRESDVDRSDSIMRATGKKLDRWIIAILAIAVVLLLANTFVLHKDANEVAAAPATTPIPDKSIAVLPLTNESGDQGQQYFSDGLSEDLITALSQFAGLKVIGRNSAFQFRDTKDDSKTIGAKLGVAHLLEGSVRRAGDEVRISAELINAADGSTLWSQRYDRPYKDLFKLQDDITNAVAGELKAKLLTAAGAVVQSDRPPSGNLEAYNAYLQGNFYYARDYEPDYRNAASYYREAVRIDPRYTQGYAALSDTETILATGYAVTQVELKQALVRARTAANTALALDRNNAAAHRALGNLRRWGDLDWIGAEAEFRRALELLPNDGPTKIQYGFMLATLGRLDQAIDVTRQGLAVDSLNEMGYYSLSSYLLPLGRIDEAEQAGRKALELQPSSSFANLFLAAVEIRRGDIAAARSLAAKMPVGVWQNNLAMLTQQVGGDRAMAEAALQPFIDKYAGVEAFQIAEAYALRKEPDKVFEWLDRAWANRDGGLAWLLYDSYLLPYQTDPRFAAFCKEVGLPTPGETSPAAK